MNNNPLINNRSYELEFTDITTEFLTANIIAKNILEKFDEEGNHQMLLDNIIDDIRDVISIGKENAFTVTTNGMKERKMTTAG